MSVFLLFFLFGLPVCYGQFSPESFQSNTDCTALNAVLVLRCISPLIDYTQTGQSNSIRQQILKADSPNEPNEQRKLSPERICTLYDEYVQCAPAHIRRGCRYFVNSVESVYEYVCSPDVRLNFTRTFECLAQVEQTQPAKNCQKNATSMLRDAATLANVSTQIRSDMQCSAISSYFTCSRDFFQKTCGHEGWMVKKETTMRSTSALVANCTSDKDDEEDMSKMVCDNQGHCTCHSGFVMETPNVCKDLDECANNFGLCSQKCLNTIGSYKCLCDERYYKLNETTNRCERIDNDPISIFFAHGQSIWNISQNGENFQLEKAGLQKTAMIDLDVKERKLYYVDIGAKVISRINFDSAFAQVIQSYEVDETEGIALDWINKKLYTVRGANMYVQESDGRFRKALYKNVFKLPRALTIFPQKGLLFTSDWGQNPFIARAHMDGSHFEKIVDKGLGWPNGLAVDYYADKLYWADAYVDIIECSNFDGTQRRTIIQDSSSVPHIFGLTVMDDYLYWTDWTYHGILRAKKFHGENVTVVAQAALLPYGIKIYHKVQQPDGENYCAGQNCSQLCLLGPHNSTLCTCADGFELLANGSCQSRCSAKELFCGQTDPKCVSRKYQCDGVSQCKNGADEANCPARFCLPGQFQCQSGEGCLAANQLCDNVTQCQKDNSDEKYC